MDVVPWVKARRPDVSDRVWRVLKRQYEAECDAAISKAQKTVADAEASLVAVRDNKKQRAQQAFRAGRDGLKRQQDEALQQLRDLQSQEIYFTALSTAANSASHDPELASVISQRLRDRKAARGLVEKKVEKLASEVNDLQRQWETEAAAADQQYQTGCDAIGRSLPLVEVPTPSGEGPASDGGPGGDGGPSDGRVVLMRWNPKNYDIDAVLAGDSVVVDQYVRPDRSLQPRAGDVCYVMPTVEYGRGRVVAKGVVVGGPFTTFGEDPFVLAPINRVGSTSFKFRLHRFDRCLPEDVNDALKNKYRGCVVMDPADANMFLAYM